jgi:hypothetical protein
MLMMLLTILGGSKITIKKNTHTLVVANKETGLEVNADKTKFIVMSQYQHVERNHNIKTDNSSFGKVEELNY